MSNQQKLEYPSRFKDYYDDFGATSQGIRESASQKFRLQVEKEATEMLNEPRQQLIADIECLLKILSSNLNENLQLSACLLIQKFNAQKSFLLQVKFTEEILLQLAADKKRVVFQFANETLIQVIKLQDQRSSIFELAWVKALEWQKVTALRNNSIQLLCTLLQTDSQAEQKLYQNSAIIQEIWNYIIDTKDPINQRIGFDCFVQVLLLKEEAQQQALLIFNNAFKGSNQSILCAIYTIRIICEQLFQDDNGQIQYIQTEDILLQKRIGQALSLMKQNYTGLIETLISKMIMKDLIIQQEIGNIIPYFVKLNREEFIKKYLDQAINFLLDRHDKSGFFGIVGKMVEIVGQEQIDKHFNRIIQLLIQLIESKKNKDFNTDALSCISSLAKACPQKLDTYINALLNGMFMQGLYPELVAALKSLASNLKNWMPLIEERLLQFVGQELNGTNISLQEGMLCMNQTQPTKLQYVPHEPKLELALDTLNQFKFEKFNLSSFCQDCVVKYISLENDKIRISASKAIINHLMHEGANFVVINNVLSQLLIVGLTDYTDIVREQIMESLDLATRYDTYLAQKDNLDVLFIGVNDSSFHVRQHVVSIIGRLSKIHPVIVLPHIREVLMSIIFELDYSHVPSTQIENVKLLLTIVKYCSNLIQPYIKSVCKTVQLIAKESTDVHILEQCLLTLSELYNQNGKELLDFIEDSIAIIVLQLKGNTDGLKICALQCVSNLAIGTCLPILPYYINTELLDILIQLIQKEQTLKVQYQAAKALVIIGALDYTLTTKMNQITLQQVKKLSEQNIDTDFEALRMVAPIQRMRQTEIVSHGTAQIDKITDTIIDKNEVIKIENKEVSLTNSTQFDYVPVVLNVIINIFQEQGSIYKDAYKDAIVTFRKVVYNVSNKSINQNVNIQVSNQIEQILNFIFKLIDKSSDSIVYQETYISELINIISFLNISNRQYTEQVFDIANKLLGVEQLSELILCLIEEVTQKMPCFEFIQQNTSLIQKLLQYYTLQNQKEKIVIRSFNTLIVLLPSLKTQIKIILPSLLKIALQTQNKQLSIASLDCISRMCCQCTLASIQSNLIQSLLKIMKETNSKIVVPSQSVNQGQLAYNCYKFNPVGLKAFETLHLVAISLGQQFNTFVPAVNKIIVECGYFSSIFNAIVTFSLRGEHISDIILLSAFQLWREAIYQKIQEPLLVTFNLQYYKFSSIKFEQFSCDWTTEKYIDAILNLQKSCSVAPKYDPLPPSKIGVYAAVNEIESIIPDLKVELMPKNLWVCDAIDDSAQWRKWLQKLQYSLVRFSPEDVIRYCQPIACNSQKICRNLFNYSYYSFMCDNNITTDMRNQVGSTLSNALMSKNAPKDIIQQLLDLVEFLEHRGENVQQLLHDVKLGQVSETCYAYARSLRYKEQEYLNSPQSTMDNLVRTNKRLGNYESSKGVIYSELQRLNYNSIQFLFDICIKKCQQFCLEVQRQGKEKINDAQIYFDEGFKKEDKNVQNIANSARLSKFSGDGTIGNLFLEGRPVFGGLKSKINECDYNEIAKYLKNILRRELLTRLQIQNPDHIIRIIFQSCLLQLKDQLIFQLGPRPIWFESLNWYDKALDSYNEQLQTLKKLIPSLEGSKLKNYINNYVSTISSKLSCLYHLGCYKELLQEMTTQKEYLKQMNYDPKKIDQGIARYVVQSILETNDQQYDIKEYLCQIDEKNALRLIIESIQSIQSNVLMRAEECTEQLINIIMSPVIAGTLENYERAYDNIIYLHYTMELKEIIQFKKLSLVSSESVLVIEKKNLKSIWNRRLANVLFDIDTWIGILRIRKLVFDKQESIPIYLSFALQCMRNGKQYLAKSTLESLLEQSPENQLHILYNKSQKVYYATTNDIEESIQQLSSEKFEVIFTYCQYLYQDTKPQNKIAAFVHLLRLQRNIGNLNSDLVQRVFIKLAEMYTVLVSMVRSEVGMLSIGIQNVEQSNDFQLMTSSAINGVISGLENQTEMQDEVESSAYSSRLTDSTVIRKYMNQSENGVIGSIVSDLVSLQSIPIQMEQLDQEVNGFTDAKYALHWFESAERANEENISIQRCVSYVTGYIVDQLNDYEKKSSQNPTNLMQRVKSLKSHYLKESLRSYFKCIKHKDIQLPSALRLLTLWCNYGDDSAVEDEFIKGLAALDISDWIEVVPQIIALTTVNNKKIKYIIQQLLIQIGIEHPQLLVYPLMVASKREQVNQQAEALSILDQIRRAHKEVVDEAMMIGQELIRVALTWSEVCMDGIFAAIIQYNQDKKMLEMLNSIAILMQQFEQDTETPNEDYFKATYFDLLKQGWELLKKGVINNDLTNAEQAKSIFYDLHNRLKNEVNKQLLLEMTNVSPRLNQIRGTRIQLPGSQSQNITISRFLPRMNVIASKQRPRKIAIMASDNEIYAYLLKGREDLRLDERVMQLLGLINQLLQQNSFAIRHQLHATRYPCIPIGRNSGLLFWVPKSDTINDLVKNYRISKKYQENQEDKQLIQRASNYNQLSLSQKLDAFKFVTQYCTGFDLRTVFWEQAASSENWLYRRTNYTVSLAVMSMVGHILGLGDRHPANIMVNRQSGQILHIDYGDCFEACQRRSKLPEKVPFRLTRILVNAMEICGVYGLFQKSCEVTMRVLRNNKDSILAILQTFIYDPLLGWKALKGSNVIDGVFEDDQNIKKAREDDGMSGVSPVDVIKRIQQKLIGEEFDGYGSCTVEQQVLILMQQAQNFENLCQHYYGWCPLW